MTRKNIIAVCIDDCPSDFIGYMSWLNSEADGNWVTFPNSLLSTPICGPSRTTFLTGQYARRHGAITNSLANTLYNGGEDPVNMVARTLQSGGYWTSIVGKYNNGYPWFSQTGDSVWSPPGWSDTHIFKGNTDYFNYAVVDNGVETQYGETDADHKSNQEKSRAITAVQDAVEPFFVYLAPFAPHSDSSTEHPVVSADQGLYPGESPPSRANFNEADISDKPTWLQDFRPDPMNSTLVDTLNGRKMDAFRMLNIVDDTIEAMRDELAARGILDDTVIVFWADNSNLFGEHRYSGKAVPYDESIAMHLRVRYPGATARSVSSLVCNIDLAPTLCDIGGVRLPKAPDGMSLVPVIEGTNENTREALFLSSDEDAPTYQSDGWEAVRTETAKWVEYDNGDTEFYDLSTDPYELSNDAASGARGLDSVLATLRTPKPA